MSTRRIANFTRNIDASGKLTANSIFSGVDPSSIVAYDSAGLLPDTNLVPGKLAIETQNGNVYVSDGSSWFSLTIAISQRTTSWTATNLNLSYDSKTLSVGSQENEPLGMSFSVDGTKLYVVGTSGDDINQYNLSTAWDISTAIYSQTSPSIVTYSPLVQCMFISDDGTKVYTGGASSDKVTQWSLTTPWDISTLSFTQQTSSLSAIENVMTGLYFSPDGTKMFVCGTSSDTVKRWDLSTAWDVSTISLVSSTPSFGSTYEPQGVYFNNTGTQMFVFGSYFNRIYGYNLPAAWDITSLTSIGTYTPSEFTIGVDLFIHENGTKLYTINRGNDAVHQYSMVLN